MEAIVTLFKRLRRRKPTQQAPKKAHFLRFAHASRAGPEPCERDHGNE
jgi:hypothetical protein